jgi:fumarate reductase (CoM/CoB) subunit A
MLAGRGTERGGIVLDFRGRSARLGELPATVRLRWDYLKQTLGAHGRDPEDAPVEVSIFGHAFNGGVLIDERGGSTVQGLYAAGEAAAGPHGADRLGGNMLMTSQVFGHRAGQAAARAAKAERPRDIAPRTLDQQAARLAGMRRPEGRYGVAELVARLQRRMWSVSIVRDEASLRACLEEIAEAEEALGRARIADRGELRHALELDSLLLTGRLVTTAALARRESRGSHYRADFPDTDDVAWRRSIAFRAVGGRTEQTLVAL